MTTNSPNQIPEEWLSAYLDNELNEEQRQLVEAACAQNPHLAQLLEEFRATRQLVSHLPQFPTAVTQRPVNGQSSAWQDELDDGLGAMGNETWRNREANNTSLATSSDQQLNRALAEDTADTTSAHASEFEPKKSSAQLLRWLALAASILGVSFLGWMIWTKDLGVTLGAKDTLPPPSAPIQSGAMIDPMASSKSLAESDRVASGEIEAAAQEIMAAPEPSIRSLAAGAMESMPAMGGAAPMAASDLPTEFGQQARGMGGFGAGIGNEAVIGNEGRVQADAVAPAPQAAQAAQLAKPERMLEPPPGSSGIEKSRKSAEEKLPLPKSAMSVAPIERKKVNTLAATWHRSDSWTDESVAVQFESSALLQAMRPLLKYPYQAAQQLTSPNTSDIIPIAILSADEQLRKKIAETLVSTSLSPPLSQSPAGSSWVLFLSKDQSDQLIDNLKLDQLPEPGSSKSSRLFRVEPRAGGEVKEVQVLIVNQQ